MRSPGAYADWCAADWRLRGHSPFNRSSIDKGFETGAGLAVGLGGIIKLAGAVKVVTTYHRHDFTGFCVECHHRTLHRGNLRQYYFQPSRFLINLFDFKLPQVPNLKFVLWLPLAPTHFSGSDRGSVISESHGCFIFRAVNLHDQTHQEPALLILITVPVRMLEII